MSKDAKLSEARPPLTIRIGVTGSRSIGPENTEPLRARVAAALRRIRENVEDLQGRPEVQRFYRHDGTDPSRPILRMISPLAEGADRLAAKEALAQGYELHAPFPFPQAEYAKDFGAGLEEFRNLADRSTVFALDGGRGPDEAESYEAVGRYVVRNSDLLIALWDGQPARGRGGTAEIVDYAARAGVPVWWINTTNADVRLMFGVEHLKHPDRAIQEPDANVALADHFKRLVVPAQPARAQEGGLLGHAARWIADRLGLPASPLESYLEETPAPQIWPWRAHRAMLDLLAPAPAPQKDAAAFEEPPPDNMSATEAWWSEHYRRADSLSQAYGDRYRSSYVLISAVAFLAFLTSAIVEIRPKLIWPVWLELGLIFCIAGLVIVNHMRRWQERWIAYRLIAELCRNQLVLAPVGRTLPGSEILLSAEEAGVDGEEPSAESEAWVGWYFLALLRGAPILTGDAATSRARAYFLAFSLVVEQKTYHQTRRIRAAKADKRLIAGGSAFFLLVLAGVIFHLILMYNGKPASATNLNVVLPVISAASAALVALRAYAELALLARQSLRMQKAMEEMESELSSFDIDEPLASKRLGATLHRLALLLLHEVRGWAQIFRLKSVEAT